MKSIVNERYVNIPEKLQRYRFHAEYKISPELKIRNRFELCAYSGKTTESGIMLFHDLVYSPRKVPLNAVFRAAWFNTGSYNTAIYAYENDVLYSFSIPAYYGKGFRFFVNLRYRIMSCLDFWFRTGHSIYKGKESVGTGNDEINGNMKTDIKFQLRLTI